MVIKYDTDFAGDAIIENLNRIINQIFKLLPSREEGEDWEASLHNLILEITGMNRLLINQTILFSLLCKLESLSTLTDEEDFLDFRKLIFECLSICTELKKELVDI